MSDAVFVRTRIGDKWLAVLKHAACVTDRDDVEAASSANVIQPHRKYFRTDAGYERAVARAFTCAECGELVRLDGEGDENG